MLKFFGRHWFLVGVALALAVGFGLAPQLTWLGGMNNGPVVFAVLLCMSLPLETRAMWRAIRYPAPVVLATAMQFGLVPLLAWLLAPLLRADVASGLLIAASIPCTLASATVWTRRAGGNDAVSLMVTIVTNLACFLATPALLKITASADVQLDIRGMIVSLAWTVALPIALGQAARAMPQIAAACTRHKLALSVLAQCGILSILFLGAIKAGNTLRDATAGTSPLGGENVATRSPMADAKQAPADHADAAQSDAKGAGTSGARSAVRPLAALDWVAMFLAVFAVHAGALYAGYYLGGLLGLSAADRVAIGFAGSQKTLAVGLYLASRYFPGLALLPMIVYHVGQLIFDTWVADRWRAADRAPESA